MDIRSKDQIPETPLTEDRSEPPNTGEILEMQRALHAAISHPSSFALAGKVWNQRFGPEMSSECFKKWMSLDDAP
jgi:hypothetical protein